MENLESRVYKKYYCQNCGRWLGLCEEDADLSKIRPYCRMCKTNVKATILEPVKKIKKI